MTSRKKAPGVELKVETKEGKGLPPGQEAVSFSFYFFHDALPDHSRTGLIPHSRECAWGTWNSTQRMEFGAADNIQFSQ